MTRAGLSSTGIPASAAVAAQRKDLELPAASRPAETGMPSTRSTAKHSPPDDGTRQLLRWGASMVGSGLLAALLLETMLGGFSHEGASTNAGWFALIVALMCLPFGGLLLALGVAKWLRNRRTARER